MATAASGFVIRQRRDLLIIANSFRLRGGKDFWKRRSFLNGSHSSQLMVQLLTLELPYNNQFEVKPRKIAKRLPKKPARHPRISINSKAGGESDS